MLVILWFSLLGYTIIPEVMVRGMDEVLRMKGHSQGGLHLQCHRALHTGILQGGFLGWLRDWSRLGSRQWEGRSWAQAELRTVEKGLHVDREANWQEKP